MPTANETQRVAPRLWIWGSYDPAAKCDLTSTAIWVRSGMVLIDPIRLATRALDELIQHARPVAIILTNGNHARSARWYSDRFGIPLMAHADAVPELGLAVERTISDGEKVQDLVVIAITGAQAGEIALYAANGTLVVGDALIHLESHGFALLPDKYCTDAALMRESLRKLLRFEFELLTFAHGLPIIDHARQRFEQLIA
jgi:hypothetical protein